MLENGNNSPIARVMIRVFQFLVPTIPSGNYHPAEVPWTGPGQPTPPTGRSGVPSGTNNAAAPPQNGSSK
jgi:hypothetical protein